VCTVLVLATATATVVEAQAGKDPLLLEYSDYYYDLYYGDYSYDAPEKHVTAPRSIGKNKPPPPVNSAPKHNKNKKKNKLRTTPQPLPPSTPAPLPLNVRLQRLVNNEASAAEVILDILNSPASVQKQIASFLKGTLGSQSQLNRRGHSSQSAPRQQQVQEARPTKPPATRPPQTFLTQKPARKPIAQPRPTRPQPPPPTRPTPPPTRPPPPPTRPSPLPTRRTPPPTRPTRPPPPPTRPPPPPTTRPPPPPPTRPQPAPTRPSVRNSPQQDESNVPASRLVNQAFNQFPNFQNQGTKDRPAQDVSRPVSASRESPRSSGAGGRPSNSIVSDSKNNNNNFRNQEEPSRGAGINQGSSRPDTSPTSGLTIQEFLTRYPEVKRLSSRFNEEGDDLAEERERNNDGRPAFTAFTATEAPLQQPAITPRQRATPPPNTFKATSSPNRNQRPKQQKPNKPNQSQQSSRPNQNIKATTTQQNSKPQQNSRPQQSSQQNQRKNKKQGKKQQNNKQKNKNVVESVEYPEYTLDYDYYYDQLVPEHERFFQLPKLEEDPVDNFQVPVTEKSESFQIFTHFAVDKPAPPPSKPRPTSPPVQPPPPKAKAPRKSGQKNGNSKSSNAKNSIGPATPIINGQQAGPFGYPEKGSLFSDSDKVGFPERIEMIYQGFVWAFDVSYPDQDKVRHGGVHRILEDKVKRQVINLKDDHIIRITGRASPYNINRLTFHTAAGKVYGPWGDRHSDESVDFDVAAPPGHALAFFSGTVDFGVPLRSISFHWAKL